MLDINDDKKIEKRITALDNESKLAVVGFFDTHVVCEKHGGEAPKISYLLEKIQEKGFRASQSANRLTGIKTNIPYKNFLELFNKLKK
jgi:tRNA G26 N,N-dimethylase Trm1